MFGFRLWQALFEGGRWAMRQALEAVVLRLFFWGFAAEY